MAAVKPSMELIPFGRKAGWIPVFKVSAVNPAKLYQWIQPELYPPEGCVAVHPSRWDEFVRLIEAEVGKCTREGGEP